MRMVSVDEQSVASTQLGVMEWLEGRGFVLPQPRRVTSDVGELLAFHEAAEERRAAFPFGIDGVVYKVNEMALQERLGVVARSPVMRWRISLPPRRR